MAFDGNCHCGAVAFTVDADLPDTAVSCNCSHCRQKGLLLSFHPASSFTLHRGEEMLATYTFNTHKIRHRFCRNCGAQPFAEGDNPEDGIAMRAINLRAVPAADLNALTLKKVDGASH